MTKNEVLDFLNSNSSERLKQNLVRMGIPEQDSMGVSTAEVRKLARVIGTSQTLAVELWRTGYHEAKMLAVLIADIQQVDSAFIEWMMQAVVSWDLCDHLCKNLIAKLPDYEQFILNWSNDSRIYYKRAAFCLVATTAIHNEELGSSEVDKYLDLVNLHSDDSRAHVKKAISWALREIGKINMKCRDKAISLAQELMASSSKSKIWIGKNALKELELLIQVKERRRLISSNSKMVENKTIK